MAALDLVTLAALVQTIVLAVTMVLLILQFRSQEKATKDAAYQKVLDDYNDTVRLLVERPELAALLEDVARTGPATSLQPMFSPAERVVRSHMLMVYGLLERVYLLYARGWIDGETWGQWEVWLAAMAKHPLFAQIHARSEGMFDRRFQEHVSRFVPTVAHDGKGDKPPAA